MSVWLANNGTNSLWASIRERVGKERPPPYSDASRMSLWLCAVQDRADTAAPVGPHPHHTAGADGLNRWALLYQTTAPLERLREAFDTFRARPPVASRGARGRPGPPSPAGSTPLPSGRGAPSTWSWSTTTTARGCRKGR